MKIPALALLLVLAASCKKTYHCTCNTIDTKLGFVNEQHYTVKEKNESDAMTHCVHNYENSGYATGGDNCNVN